MSKTSFTLPFVVVLLSINLTGFSSAQIQNYFPGNTEANNQFAPGVAEKSGLDFYRENWENQPPIPTQQVSHAQPVGAGVQGGQYLPQEYVQGPTVAQGQEYFQEPQIIQQNSPVQQIVSNASRDVHSVASVMGLALSRDYNDNQLLSTSPGGDLFSNDATHGVMAGLEATLARRRANGRGYEFRYFQLFPETASSSLSDAGSATALGGLSGLTDAFGGPAATFAAAPTHVVNRDSELINIELNLLRNGANVDLTPRLNRLFPASESEWLFGPRYILFGETLLYQAIDPPASPDRTDFFSSTENQMVGFQFGRRSSRNGSGRYGLHWGWKLGAYNNKVNIRQRVDNVVGGVVSNPVTVGGSAPGSAFDIGGEENEISVVGEIELALTIQFSRRMRGRIGYRAIGLTDVATATDQIEADFTNLNSVAFPTINDDVLFHGAVMGLEFAY